MVLSFKCGERALARGPGVALGGGILLQWAGCHSVSMCHSLSLFNVSLKFPKT